MLSLAYQEAIVEVLSILDASPKEEVDKIPKKLIRFFNDNASTTYTFFVNKNVLIKDMNLKRETHALLAMLYRNYLCTPEEKSSFDNLLKENQEKHDAEIREKYNVDNIFKNNNYTDVIQKTQSQDNSNNSNNSLYNKNAQLIEYKESFLSKIINKIKSFFKRS